MEQPRPKKQLTPAQKKRRAQRRAQKRRRRRLILIGIAACNILLVGGLLWLILFLTGSRAASVENEATPSPSATPFETPEPTQAPATMPPPSIEEDWYIERNQRLYTYMKAYGSYDSDDAIYARIDQMQIDKSGKMVALTFDDGPYSPYTDQILDILEENGARATFFIKGAYVEGKEYLIERELALGCDVGNHTMNHDDLEKLSDSEMYQSVGGVNDILKTKFNYTTHLLRPPYISYGEKGSEKRNAIVKMCQEYELAIVNHTRSSHDTYAEYTADMIVERMLLEKDELGRGIDGSIFLFHDKYQWTVDAVKVIIPKLQEMGYQLVTVTELLSCSEEGFHYGWIYSKAD